jgi:hypothetical protein
MDKSIFTDKNRIPVDSDLAAALGSTLKLWQQIRDHVHARFPAALDEWNYPGDKYGWSFRIKDSRRAIVHLLPRDQFFKAALVFGQKATAAVLTSTVSDDIKTALQSAKAYAEGRGIRINVQDKATAADIRTLIDIKLAH